LIFEAYRLLDNSMNSLSHSSNFPVPPSLVFNDDSDILREL